MKYFYDLIFLLFSIIYLPYLAIKGKAHRGFTERFGVLPKYFKGDKNDAIWIHAVSVGEVKAAESLIRRMKEAFPEKRVILSTTTKTGNETAGNIFGDSIPKFYFPLDFHFICDKTIVFINPVLFVLFETDIWPNLITALYRRKIPVVLVNGRISDKSFRGYRLIKSIFGITLRKMTKFLMQTDADAERIKSLGAPPDKVKVCGNVKYDIDQASGTRQQASGLDKKILGIKEEEDLIICGSTHKGEEEILLQVYKDLLGDFSNLRLLIAPRHIDRIDDIEKVCEKFGFKTLRVSETPLLPDARCPMPVLILDTIGRLAHLFSIADIVFMGGSLIKKGGHNLVEPALYAKPIIFGPYMNNFRDMADQFLAGNASVMVKNKEELLKVFKHLLNNKSEREELGKRAFLLIGKNKGAVSRIIEEMRIFV